jgi:hypothetical protein
MITLQCSQQSSSIWSSSWYPLTCIRYIGATGQKSHPNEIIPVEEYEVRDRKGGRMMMLKYSIMILNQAFFTRLK